MDEHAKKGTWRAVAEGRPGVSLATLNRIATSGGDWLPKNKTILERLGLTAQKRKIKRYVIWTAEGKL